MQKISEKVIIDNGYRKCIQRLYETKGGAIANFLVLSDSTDTDSVGVLAFDEDKNCILIREYRVGPELYTYGAILGGCEQELSYEENAKKELQEETGYTVGKIISLGTVINNPYYTRVMHLYLAYNCKKTTVQQLSADEDISLQKYTIEEVKKLLCDGVINCPYTHALYLRAEQKTNNFTTF